MPTIKLPKDVQYFAWRDGRPRWIPSPRLRKAGWKGRDLKDDAGHWLALDAALDAVRAINAEVAERGGKRAPRRFVPASRSVDQLLEAYLESRDFERRSDGTQADYRAKISALRYKHRTRDEINQGKPQEAEPFAQEPAAAIGAPEVKAFFEHLEQRRGLAMARGCIMVLSAAYAWGRTSTEWRLKLNPCLKLGLPTPEPRIRVATDAELYALIGAADALGRPSIGDAVYIALFCGQRRADIMALEDRLGANRVLAEAAAAGEPIRFKQGKTGAKVAIFPAPQLVARLRQAEERRRQLSVVPRAIVVNELTGKAYYRRAWEDAFKDVRQAAIEGVPDDAGGWKVEPCPSVATFRFADLRDTAITWLGRAGCEIPEIAAISGHSLRSIYTILKHYLELDEGMARSAILKLVKWIEDQGIKL